MPCYHPMIAIPDGNFPSGKTKYKIVDRWFDKDINLWYGPGAITIPCGKCIGCRLDYSRQWANRLMMELQYHDSAYFVTLTYDDDHIPVHDYIDPETGEVLNSLSLCKRDFQLFMKRLRKRFSNDKIRFYACGEYGSTTLRPHYHAIIFGLHLDDLRVFSKSAQGFVYYNSDSFQDCWSVYRNGVLEPLGYAVLADVTWETCAYTARYVTKKLSGAEAQYYEMCNIEPVWSLMSRKPGLGYQYYLDHPEGMKNDVFCLSSGRKVKPPRYFSKLYELDNPEESDRIKAIRKSMAAAHEKVELSRTDLDKNEYLMVKEAAKERSIKALRRSQI